MRGFLSIALERIQHLPKQSAYQHGRERCFWAWQSLLKQSAEEEVAGSYLHPKLNQKKQEAEVLGWAEHVMAGGA